MLVTVPLAPTDVFIHRIMQPLLASQVAFWRLDESMSKEKLDLLQLPASLAAGRHVGAWC
jgi:hypothetical protein